MLLATSKLATAPLCSELDAGCYCSVMPVLRDLASCPCSVYCVCSVPLVTGDSS
jgi:hypothetical protein